jgi:transcriptional regulator with XRE-family HTH domain
MEGPFKIMSQKTHFLSEIESGEPIPEANLAYLEQRALNHFYDYVIGRFLERSQANGLTKAKLAKRIGRGQDQVNRLLASPGNWTIGTVARLLAGIAGEEPILVSESLIGRPARNSTVLDSLEDVEIETNHISKTANSSNTISMTIQQARQ